MRFLYTLAPTEQRTCAVERVEPHADARQRVCAALLAVDDAHRMANDEPGELVCLVEDVVTSGGALRDAVEAVRAAGLVVRHAVCVVDREEGGADALARLGVRLTALYRAGDLLATRGAEVNPHR